MKTPIVLTRLLATTLTASMCGLFSATAGADPDPWYPQGMMMQGSGGYGPGMMGSCDPEMMGHMGSSGRNMMGGYGHGMMGYRSLNLSKEQRTKINQINDDTRKKHWELMGRMQELSSNVRNLYDADKWDAIEIGKAYQKIFDLKRQMIESSVEAHNRKDAVLTKEQREQLKKTGARGGMMWREP